MKPRVRTSLSVLFGLVLVSACGPGSAQSPQGGGASAGGGAPGSPGASAAPMNVTGTLSVYAFGCTTGDEIAKVRLAEFKKKYSDVKVACTEGDFDPQQFLTSVRSGKPADAVHMSRNTIGTYIAQGVLKPLDDCISKAAIDMGKFRKAAVDQVTVDGKVYGIPEFFNTRVLMLNGKVLNDAGVTADQVDTSNWDGLKTANDKLLKKSGDKLSRIGFDPKLPEFLPLWAKINGADILSADGKTSQLDDPKVAEALAFARDLIQAQASAPKFFSFRDSVSGDFFGAKNPYATDVEGGMPMEQWYLNVLAENSPNVDLVVKPIKAKDGNEITFSDGESWAIPTAAKNPDAACALAATMTDTATWAAAAQARADARATAKKPCGGTYTANKEADDKIFGPDGSGGICKPSGNAAFDDAIKTVLAVQDKAFALPPAPAAKAFEDDWRAAVGKVLNSGADPVQALKDADTKAQQELDDAAGG